jgi:hypothetical protein
MLIDIYYKGYHTTLEGKSIFDAIKLHMNKYRLTTNINLLKNKNCIPISKIKDLIIKLNLLESPYEIKQGVRYYRNTYRLVSESNEIVAILENNSKFYSSISDCAVNLNISKKYIKECLQSGKSYKGYNFVYK